MLGWLRRRRLTRDRQRLERLHRSLLEQARDLQRKGDIRGFAAMTEAGATVERQLDEALAREAAQRVVNAR